MFIRAGKKVVCVRDIPSNMIEEAIFILKSDVIEKQENKYEQKTKEILLREAEDFVNDYILKLENATEKKKDIDIKYTTKKEIVYIIGLLILLGVCISFVI